MSLMPFTGSFTQQPPIPEAANAMMRLGRLHHYNMEAGQESEGMAMGREYAAWQKTRFCLAVASGGAADRLTGCAGVGLPHRPGAESCVGSSIQFLIPGISSVAAADFVARLARVGVALKWFGARRPVGITSDHHSWRYVAAQDLPKTDAILAGLFDMPLPLTFRLAGCALLADHILYAAASFGAQSDV